MRIDVNICEFMPGPSPGFGARERNVNWAPHIDRGWNAAYIWRNGRITKPDHNGMADGLTEIQSHVKL